MSINDTFVFFCRVYITRRRHFDSFCIHLFVKFNIGNHFLEEMSYTEINNQERYFENLTLGNTNMNNDFTELGGEDDLFYEAELVAFNDTHDCIRLLQASEVRKFLYATCIKDFRCYDAIYTFP